MLKQRTWILFAMLILPLIASSSRNSYGQGDTVKYRLCLSLLGDSTLIRYELGSLGFTHSGTTQYLQFADTLPGTLGAFYRTRNFRVLANSDSISLFRYASFDDKHAPGSFDVTDTNNPSGFDTAKLIQNASDIASRYVDTEFYVHPNASSFTTGSTIQYIVELRRASDDYVLGRIDTLACFLDAAGKLKYTFYPYVAGNVRIVSLASVSTNTDVYLTVARSTSLPTGSSIVHDDLTNESNNLAAGTQFVYGGTTYQPGDRGVAAPLFHSGVASEALVGQRGMLVAPGDRILRLSFEAAIGGTATLHIFDASGKLIIQSANTVVAGKNGLILDTSSLPSGEYNIVISSMGTVLLHQKSIVVH